MPHSPKLVSACLLGIRCAWDGKDKYKNDRVMELAKREVLIPVCPEQLGGLRTPRSRQEIQGGTGDDVLDGRSRVLTEKGESSKTQICVLISKLTALPPTYKVSIIREGVGLRINALAQGESTTLGTCRKKGVKR